MRQSFEKLHDRYQSATIVGIEFRAPVDKQDCTGPVGQDQLAELGTSFFVGSLFGAVWCLKTSSRIMLAMSMIAPPSKAIPMLAGQRLIGAFTVYRQTVRPFDDKALETAQMFADQSVIAIENARLINR